MLNKTSSGTYAYFHKKCLTLDADDAVLVFEALSCNKSVENETQNSMIDQTQKTVIYIKQRIRHNDKST